MIPGWLSPTHLVLLLLVLLIVVGPGKLPETGEALGKAVRGFKDAFEGHESKATPVDPQAHAPQPPQQSQAPQQAGPYQQAVYQQPTYQAQPYQGDSYQGAPTSQPLPPAIVEANQRQD